MDLRPRGDDIYAQLPSKHSSRMKKIIIPIIALIVILAGISLWVYRYVDMNGYKAGIVALVKEKTGYNIVINGDIRLRVLPDVAIEISRISLQDPHGGRMEDAIYVKQMLLHLKTISLIKKKIKIGSVKLINPEFRYVIFKDGSNNFSNITEKDANDGEESDEDSKENLHNNYAEIRKVINDHIVNQFKLKHVTVQSAKISFSDERRDLSVAFEDANIETALTSQINPFEFSAKMRASYGINVPFTMHGNFQLAKDNYDFTGIEMKIGDVKTVGEIGADFQGILPEANVKFYFEDMDATPYAGFIDFLGSAIHPANSDAQKSASDENDDAFEWSDEPIDFMALRNFNASLSLKSNKILYKDNNIGSITIYAYLRNGKFTFSVKEAEVFSGNLNSETSIDVTSNIPKVKYKLNLEDVDLTTMPGNIPVFSEFTGRVNGGTALTSHGSSLSEIVENLDGAVSLKADDGVIKNINLVSMAKNVASSFESDKNSKTEFKELSGDFDVTAGVLKSDNLMLTSDVLDFNGRGTISVPEMAINLRVSPKVKKPSDETDILGGIKAPIIVNGDVMQPSFKLEIQNLVEDVIKNPKATENLVKQLKNDFKDIKNNMKTEPKDKNDGGFFGTIKNIF